MDMFMNFKKKLVKVKVFRVNPHPNPNFKIFQSKFSFYKSKILIYDPIQSLQNSGEIGKSIYLSSTIAFATIVPHNLNIS
jgi:hypothetical protein